jgi:hypothetical protein
MAKKKTLKDINEALRIGSVMLCFTLRLNISEWGMYKKGEQSVFYVDLLNEQNGLARYGIDKRWDIIDCYFINKA